MHFRPAEAKVPLPGKWFRPSRLAIKMGVADLYAGLLGQVRGSGVSVLSESRDSVIGGVRVRLGVDVGSLGCFFGGLRVAVIEGVGGYEVSGLFQARQRHVALLLDPIIMLLG